MRHARNDDFLATSKATESSLLLGSHEWVVHNDSVKCTKEGVRTYKANLTLHACDLESFACANAFCVPMEKRCNAKEDCADGSDEQDCGGLIKSQGYMKELTPIPETGHNVLVNFSVNIRQIEVHENTLMVKISYTRYWFDGRLMYKHLKRDPERNMNTFPPAEFEDIWYPLVIFDNIRSQEDWKATDVPDVLRVIPNENFKYSAEDNMHIFKGSENALSLTREFNVEWNCDYAYHWYPFDSQVCRMEILSSKSSTELQPTLLQHNPNISLSRYTLRRIRMCKTVFEDMPGIIVELTLGRPIVNNLLTVFVPTVLLVTISFAARCFATDYIDMVIQVNLTILLVLATM